MTWRFKISNMLLCYTLSKSMKIFHLTPLVLLACLTGCQAANVNRATSTEATNTSVTEQTETGSTVIEQTPPEETISEPQHTQTKVLFSNQIPNIASAFAFSANIPANWEVEYVPAIEAINVYDPTIDADTPLEQSQIFIRYFSANDFLTLSTVTIHSRTATKTNDRPTVIYDIEKKPGIANFTSQPTWRNARHVVTDIRSTDTRPAIFYVFAKHPELNQATFDLFIDSVQFSR